VFPVLVFIITRVVGAVLIDLASTWQVELGGTAAAAGYQVTHPLPADPGYLGVVTNWDGQWYWKIAQSGYPGDLPRAEDGRPAFSEWAFYPLFPLLARIVMAGSGLAFPVVAAALATTASLLAIVLTYRLIVITAGHATARVVVVLLCTSMAAPAFQVAYTEGPALLLLAAALHLLVRHRYLACGLVLWALALTRPIVAPFVLVIAMHGLVRHRKGDLPVADRYRIVGLVASTLCATSAWPAVAAVVTGVPDAFTRTQSQWRLSSDIGPFGLVSVAHSVAGWGGAGLVVLGGTGLALLAASSRASAWGCELRTWAGTYAVYLVAVVPVATSLFRFSLLAFPLFWIWPNVRSSRRRQWLMVALLTVAGLAAQWYWVRHFLIVGPLDLQVGMP
jgi:hypothetical protein